MRASRLLQLLVRLQLRGSATAPELAEALGVSVRTVYRDVEALSAAGVPVWTETGRRGGVRIDPAYRVAGLPRLDPTAARGVLFAVVPAIAEQLGLDAGAAERTLLPAMERTSETTARVVRDRLLVEPTHWFVPPDHVPALGEVARAVWEAREARLTYRGRELTCRPLGLVLKGDTWYLLAQEPGSPDPHRLFRLSRVEAVAVREQRFTRPDGFDLAAAWAERQASFRSSLPRYAVTVRVAPEAESLLGLLNEGAPPLPLPDDVARDDAGWAVLSMVFERSPAGTARHLLRLGAGLEVLEPPELRELVASTAVATAALYRRVP